MIAIVSVSVVAMLLASYWVAGRFRQWGRDRTDLMREVSELTTHALVLQEHSSQAIVKFETSGLIRNVNSAAEELFGYTAAEMLGQNILKLLPKAPSLSGPGEALEIRCRDGSRLQVPFVAVQSDLTRASYIYLFFDPLSEETIRRESPTGREAASPEASGKSTPPAQPPLSYVARIVGRIASQYETLLTTINGYSELALTEAPVSSPLHQELQEIVTASDRASSLTRHLVAFSGSQLTPVEPVDLNRLVRDMRAELVGAVACPIDFDLQPIDQASLANVEFLREVILLLCGSARGRMADNDRLQVRTRLCDLTERRMVQSGELKPGMYAALTISDSGRPLDAQIKEHLFEPLYLIHEDMGVELSPIYGIVQSLGGGIDVVTGEDIGTSFEILLPCEHSAQPASA